MVDGHGSTLIMYKNLNSILTLNSSKSSPNTLVFNCISKS